MSVRFLVFALVAGAAVGCAAKGGSKAGVKVTGKVTHNGTPVAGARVIFTDGKDAGGTPAGLSAITDDAGEYTVVGLPPGAYKVVVYKLVATKGSKLPEEMMDLEQIEASGAGAHGLPKKYAKVATTTLAAQVDSGENTADFKLTGAVDK